MAALSCLATDGDTLRCGSERVRLVGIDAPEMPGHCASGRICVKGDPFASRDALSEAMRGKTLTIVRLGKDRYGRTIADVRADGKSLSCAQIKAGQAIYVKKWDNGQTVARQCGE
ncbi:hypothetical protein ABAC460_10140 [Asticcacaulis sp. AC460]|uniref:thermonuclease family protein n=1 Tax=Asticcacaulis sp. AC460 TaxID=1282360 RepID=UPI0003C3D880|nr:thermonuclease family protein [Asticcacaulis sp. AC460]ESQ90117.1 hypothetical protein ABAC460_10140 [Asticcacaulis sp. AC460]